MSLREQEPRANKVAAVEIERTKEEKQLRGN